MSPAAVTSACRCQSSEAKASLAVRNPERRVSSARELARAVHQPLEHLVDRQLRGDRQHGVADGLQRRVQALRHSATIVGALALAIMPRHWFWTQAAIFVFVLAGIVIAITKLV